MNLQIKIQNNQPRVLSAYLVETNSNEEVPQKQLLNYKEYDIVEFFSSVRILTKDNSGNLLPYLEWESAGKAMGHGYKVEEGFHLECRKIDSNEDYYVMFVVEDIHGKSYASDLFALQN